MKFKSYQFKSYQTVAVGMALACMAVLGQPQTANANGSVDARIRRALDGSSIAYNVTDSGNLRALIPLKSGRTQLVVINSDTNTVGSSEIREVWSIGYRGSSVSAQTAMMLLTENESKVLGSWSVVKSDNNYFASFAVRLDADTSPQKLIEAIGISAQVADELEQRLTQKDDY